MISANNVAHLTPSRRAVVEPMRFVTLSPQLQRSMLEWFEQSEIGFPNVLANTLIVGRSTFVYSVDRRVFLNEQALRNRVANIDDRLSRLAEIAALVGDIDRPKAFECYMAGDSQHRLPVIVLPVTQDGERLYMMTIGEW